MQKKKVLKKFIAGELTLDDAHENAKPSGPLKKIKDAKEKVMVIENSEISDLERSEINALLVDVNKLYREVGRVQLMVAKAKEAKEKNVT